MTTEEWREVADWPDYHVSNLGRVRSMKDRCLGDFMRILKPLRGPGGYPQVNLHHGGFRATRPIHRLVAAAFLGPTPEGQEIRHKDGNSGNPRLSNLEFGTGKDNYEDARQHGTYSHGERHGKATTTEEAVIQMRRLRAARVPLATLAKMFGQSTTNVSDICNRKIWKHVQE